MRGYHAKILAAALVLVGAAGTLIYLGLGDSKIYYAHTDEFFKEEARFRRKDVRINGKVSQGTLVRGPEPLHYAFQLGEGTARLRVTYVGPVPDALKEGADVVVEGRYEGNMEIKARTLMTKCPSKYEEKPDREKGGGGDKAKPPLS